jgi:hypothetical protein
MSNGAETVQSLFQNSGELEDSTILKPLNSRLTDLCNLITKGTVQLYGKRQQIPKDHFED